MRVFADDPHFGVREWSWLALRPHIVKNPLETIALLQPWVTDPSANVRRFAIEATRPRGVWSAHIKTLKEEPEVARNLLDEVASDSSRYVQDSVANWLNDAWKTNPQWVDDYCTSILCLHNTKEATYIAKRALRNKK